MFFGFLASTSPKIRDKFFPLESQSECDKLLAWYEARLRPSCHKLTQSITKFKQISATASTQVTDINKDIESLIRYYLSVLEQRLDSSKTPFLTGKSLTALDILLYCELSGILVLTEKQEVLTDSNKTEFPQLTKWYLTRMGTIPQIIQLDKKHREIVLKNNHFY